MQRGRTLPDLQYLTFRGRSDVESQSNLKKSTKSHLSDLSPHESRDRGPNNSQYCRAHRVDCSTILPVLSQSYS